MERGHKAISLLVLWLATIGLFLVGVVFGGQWFAVICVVLLIALGVACLAIMVIPLPPEYPPGFCKACGYDLTGNQSGRCSECGTPAALTLSAPHPNPSSNQHAPAS